MTELAQLAAHQRCGFAKLMADVPHILSRESDQLDAKFFAKKYEVCFACVLSSPDMRLTATASCSDMRLPLGGGEPARLRSERAHGWQRPRNAGADVPDVE